MEEIPNIYEWNEPYDLLNLFDTKIYGDRDGIMYVTSASEQMLLFKVSGRYVLPSKKDIVKFRGWSMGNKRGTIVDDWIVVAAFLILLAIIVLVVGAV